MTLQTQITNIVSSIRSMSDQFLLDTCQIYKKTGESVVKGQVKPIYAAPITVSCRFINRAGTEITNVSSQERLAQQTTHIGLFRIHLPFDTEITDSDYLLFEDRKFHIISIPTKHAMSGAFIVIVQETK